MMPGHEFSGVGKSRRAQRARRVVLCGFSILELIIALVILAFLIALLLPAVEAAREPARRAQCVNNLKQLALGCLNYESANKTFPTNGWGSDWLGDPNRKVGITQPGGWLFNILPYAEESPLYKLQEGKTGAELAAAATEMAKTPLPQLHCPSRRAVQTYPYTHKPMANGGAASFYTTGLFCDAAGTSLVAVAKSDYAGNGGQRYWSAETLPGDAMCDDGGPLGATVPPAANPYELFDAAMKDNKPIKDEHGRWKLTPQQGIDKFAAAGDGIFYPFSTVTIKDISDGTSNTYLCGEKFMPSDHYTDGLDDGDDQCAYMGHDDDITRWASSDTEGETKVVMQDFPAAKAGAGGSRLFGSAHAGMCNMAFCDGSVHQISYGIDAAIHARLANRKDGKEIDAAMY